jgi:predicted homoserine dehydrogenase-like protein
MLNDHHAKNADLVMIVALVVTTGEATVVITSEEVIVVMTATGVVTAGTTISVAIVVIRDKGHIATMNN